jgi:hypothetical protein
MTMKPDRHAIGKLALGLTLILAALLFPSSPARAGQGHGGGHAGSGVAMHSAHHGLHPYAVGYGWPQGGYYPYWGYGSSYAGGYGYGGGYYGYGIYSGSAGPYFGGVPNFWGPSSVTTSSSYNFMNSIDLGW